VPEPAVADEDVHDYRGEPLTKDEETVVARRVSE
jgi:hypothetical protein